MTDTATAYETLAPIEERHRVSTAGNQFWIWAGANIAPINWVLGALGIQIGLGIADTVTVLILGNLIGMAVFGVFVLMGQRTGVTQMVQSRSAFGRRGAYLPTAIQGVMSAGWCAINTWIVLDLVVALLDKLGWHGGTPTKIVVVALVMGLQVWIAANGFAWIALFEKYTVPVTIAILLVMTVVAWSRLDVNWSYAGDHLSGTARLSAMSTVMTAIGIGWGITWFAYASDYSRFISRRIPRSRVYLASCLGQFLPVVWLGVLGASLASVNGTIDPGALIVESFGGLAIPVLLLVLHGPIATNILNIYSCAVCAQALDLKVRRRTVVFVVGLFAFAFTIVLIYAESFAESLDSWLAGLVTWVAPWAGIMLTHYFAVMRGGLDIEALYDDTGRRLPAVRWSAVIAFGLGIFATWTFEYGVPSYLQGFGAKALNGVDLSWLAGALVAAITYAIGARLERGTRAHAQP